MDRSNSVGTHSVSYGQAASFPEVNFEGVEAQVEVEVEVNLIWARKD